MLNASVTAARADEQGRGFAVVATEVRDLAGQFGDCSVRDQGSDIIVEGAAASSEQAAGIDKVNLAVTSMDEGTQQNAAIAEQASAASSAVRDKAQEMKQLTDFFRLPGMARTEPANRQAEPAAEPRGAVRGPAVAPLASRNTAAPAVA